MKQAEAALAAVAALAEHAKDLQLAEIGTRHMLERERAEHIKQLREQYERLIAERDALAEWKRLAIARNPWMANA